MRVDRIISNTHAMNQQPGGDTVSGPSSFQFDTSNAFSSLLTSGQVGTSGQKVSGDLTSPAQAIITAPNSLPLARARPGTSNVEDFMQKIPSIGSVLQVPSNPALSGVYSVTANASPSNTGTYSIPDVLQGVMGMGNKSTLNNENMPDIRISSGLNEESSGHENNSYRDFSRIPLINDPTNFAVSPASSSGKEPPFPVKLHRILSNAEFRDIITWLPHGRSWRVLKPKAFEEKVIPLYFRHAKYASFMRQVNGWGFRRMTQGPDHNSYYHELFLRGLSHLCLKMRRPARAKSGSNEPEINPDFYRLSMIAPLPNEDAPSIILPGAQGLGLGQNSLSRRIPNLEPCSYMLQQQESSLNNSSLPGRNTGVSVSDTPLSASSILQQHIQGQLQKGTSNSGQAPGSSFRNSTNSAIGESTYKDQLEMYRQKVKERADLVSQLTEAMDRKRQNKAESDMPKDVTSQVCRSKMLAPSNEFDQSQASSVISNYINSDSTQQLNLQQIMSQLNSAQLNAFGMGGVSNCFLSHSGIVGMPGSEVGPYPLRQMPSGINQQPLAQQNLAHAVTCPGTMSSLLSPNFVKLGLISMQNQDLLQTQGSTATSSNPTQQQFHWSGK